MDNFERCQKVVGVAEGGDNFDVIDGKPVLKYKSRNDTGGPTRYGITIGTLSRAYSQGIVSHNDITKMTKPEAHAIYRQNYWVPSRSDKMQWGLCLVHYDCAVNCGVGGAAKQMQRAINNASGRAVVSIDGVIGPKSLEAIGKDKLTDLTEAYLRVRESFYYGLVAKNASQGDFLKGWLNRLARLRGEVANG